MDQSATDEARENVPPSSAQKQVLMYGAGKIGRGFMGQLLADSGYQVTFVDIIPELVEALDQRGSYRLALVTNEARQERVIQGVRCVPGWDLKAVAAQLLEIDVVATAVGVRSLPDIAPFLAQGIALRSDEELAKPLNIIICENLKDAPRALHEMLEANLPIAHHPYLHKWVGLVDAVIDRMVPEVPADVRAKDPSFILTEPYGLLQVNKWGFVGEIPEIAGMQAVENIQASIDRKLYLHNGGHAMLAYLGSLKGLVYGYEALADPDVRKALLQAWDETALALQGEYAFTPANLRAYMRELEERWANRALSDTLSRLGRDPLRKLGPTDRLVGPAKLALKQGVQPEALALGIAAGLRFADPSDPQATELQGLLAAHGVRHAIREVCGLDPDGELGQLILAQYDRLCQGQWPG